MNPQRIQRSRARGWRLPAGVICVSRPTRWGNPIRWTGSQMLGPDGCEVMLNGLVLVGAPRQPPPYAFLAAAFDGWLAHPEQADLREAIRRELRGRDLACWCPLTLPDGSRCPCHADVLLTIANR
jgi:hypothetical protein